MKIIIVNGPNLNLLGVREPEIYGRETFEDFFAYLQAEFPTVTLHYFQSNHEVGFSYDGIVLNAGAYTHTSVALADAIGGIRTPVVEVHISNVHAREAFRQNSFLSAKCVGSIVGLGLKGYELAVEYFVSR